MGESERQREKREKKRGRGGVMVHIPVNPCTKEVKGRNQGVQSQLAHTASSKTEWAPWDSIPKHKTKPHKRNMVVIKREKNGYLTIKNSYKETN